MAQPSPLSRLVVPALLLALLAGAGAGGAFYAQRQHPKELAAFQLRAATAATALRLRADTELTALRAGALKTYARTAGQAQGYARMASVLARQLCTDAREFAEELYFEIQDQVASKVRGAGGRVKGGVQAASVPPPSKVVTVKSAAAVDDEEDPYEDDDGVEGNAELTGGLDSMDMGGLWDLAEEEGVLVINHDYKG